jgi:hypothetical protein
MGEFDLGTCPIVVMDEVTAHQAGRWVEEMALKQLKRMAEPEMAYAGVRLIVISEGEEAP